MDNNSLSAPSGAEPTGDDLTVWFEPGAIASDLELVFVSSAIGFRVWFYEEFHRMLRNPVFGSEWGYRRWVPAKCGCFERPCRCGISAFIQPEDAIEYGERIKGGGARVLGLVQGIRDLSREVFRNGNGEETVGWKSQQQRILALVTQEDGRRKWAKPDVLELVAQAWSVPILSRGGVEIFLDRRFGGT